MGFEGIVIACNDLWVLYLPKLLCVTFVAQSSYSKKQLLSTDYVALCGPADNQPMRNATRLPYRYLKYATVLNTYA